MRLILFFCYFSISLVISGQNPPNSPEDIEKIYLQNIRKSRIDGVYIPKDIEEAVQEIIRLSPAESLNKFSSADEDLVVKKLHFGLGKWVANKWNFIEGSRYSHYLKKLGVLNPDEMIEVTLRSLHRSLNKVPLNLEQQILAIELERKKEIEARKNAQLLTTKAENPTDSLKKN